MDKKKLLKIELIFSFITFLLTFIVHNLYNVFKVKILIPFAPVNESIFEHLKIFFTSYIISDSIKYLFLKKENYNFINYKISSVINIIFNIFIFMIIYMPIYINFGHNLLITLILLLITIFITGLVNYYILLHNKFSNLNKYAIPIMVVLFFIFLLLTLFPFNNNFFLDEKNKKLGLKNIY